MSQVLPSDSESIVKVVHDAYSAKAREGAEHSYASNVAQAFGYTLEQLESIPSESHMGLSCGNPVAAATIKPGEVVLDLGSGGGIDTFLAADKAGPTGQAIGLDMSADMISLARRNAAKRDLHPPQVSFVQALLTEPLPITASSVDCILSNCVINLLPLESKASLLKETYRVLKSGGRIILDDIIAKQPMPDNIRNDLAAYVGCIAGAISIVQYKSLLEQAGFKDSLFLDTKGDINVYKQFDNSANTGCCSAPCKPVTSTDSDFDANIWVASYQIYAVKDDKDGVATKEAPLSKWWDAYPIAKSSPSSITPDELAALLRGPEKGEVAVVDVRRNDHAGGHVRGSFQHPAQTFFDERSSFFDKFGKTKRVVFYCGSSNGRGPRCAGWYQDYLDELAARTSTAYVLKGGIRCWLEAYAGQEGLIDYDP